MIGCERICNLLEFGKYLPNDRISQAQSKQTKPLLRNIPYYVNTFIVVQHMVKRIAISLYTTVLENARIPWNARAIWTEISLKAEGTFLHFRSSPLCPFRSTCSLFFSLSTWSLRRIRIGRYCFLFPKGTLGQFHVAGQRSQSIQKQMYVGHFWGWPGVDGGGRGWGRGRRGESKESSSDVSQFPQSTRYERSPRQISLIEHVFFYVAETELSEPLIKFFIIP